MGEGVEISARVIAWGTCKEASGASHRVGGELELSNGCARWEQNVMRGL